MNPLRVAIIERAVSGSGKSTFAKTLVRELGARGVDSAVHSTDAFFCENGSYRFSGELLAENHQRNLDAFRGSLACGVPVVICDNTNLVPEHAMPYVDAARLAGYKTLLLNFLPRLPEEQFRLQVHGLSVEAVLWQVGEWNRWRASDFSTDAVLEMSANFPLDCEPVLDFLLKG